MNNTDNIYYIYAWYFTNTNEIFYIGKGKGDRYKYVGTRRNEYFLNIIKKYKDNVNVKKLYENFKYPFCKYAGIFNCFVF